MGSNNKMKPGTLFYDDYDKEYGIMIKECDEDKSDDKSYDVYWFEAKMIISTDDGYLKNHTKRKANEIQVQAKEAGKKKERRINKIFSLLRGKLG